MSRDKRGDIADRVETYFYNVFMKDLVKLVCFWGELFNQINEVLTNFRFNIFRIRRIIPYEFLLLLYIDIISCWYITQLLFKWTFTKALLKVSLAFPTVSPFDGKSDYCFVINFCICSAAVDEWFQQFYIRWWIIFLSVRQKCIFSRKLHKD